MTTSIDYTQIYKTSFFLPVKTQKLQEAISKKQDGLEIPIAQLNCSTIEYCKKEFGELDNIPVQKQYYFHNMKNIKENKKLDLDLLLYIPFIENDMPFIMVVFLSKFQSDKFEHNIRYVYKLNSGIDKLKFCKSYEDACLVLLSYFKILQGTNNGKN